MTTKEREARYAKIEQDVDNIMRQLYGLEYKIERNVPRPVTIKVVKPQMPSFLKRLWMGFKEEISGRGDISGVQRTTQKNGVSKNLG